MSVTRLRVHLHNKQGASEERRSFRTSESFHENFKGPGLRCGGGGLHSRSQFCSFCGLGGLGVRGILSRLRRSLRRGGRLLGGCAGGGELGFVRKGLDGHGGARCSRCGECNLEICCSQGAPGAGGAARRAGAGAS